MNNFLNSAEKFEEAEEALRQYLIQKRGIHGERAYFAITERFYKWCNIHISNNQEFGFPAPEIRDEDPTLTELMENFRQTLMQYAEIERQEFMGIDADK
jgi:hypothetical protein